MSISNRYNSVVVGAIDTLHCYVNNSTLGVTLDPKGQILNTPIIKPYDGTVFEKIKWGDVWAESVFTCESSKNGFLCAATVGSNGGYFAISTDGISSHSD